jgi:hypothetical protein
MCLTSTLKKDRNLGGLGLSHRRDPEFITFFMKEYELSLDNPEFIADHRNNA